MMKILPGTVRPVIDGWTFTIRIKTSAGITGEFVPLECRIVDASAAKIAMRFFVRGINAAAKTAS